MINSLWRSLWKSLTGRTGKPPAAQAAGGARLHSTVPPGVFDRRPVGKYNTAHGLFYLPADYAGDAAARAIANGAPVAAIVAELARRYVVPGSITIDVGAGFGQISALLSELTGPAGQVLAFEADEYLCDILQQTARINHRENVRVFFGAVYDGSRPTVCFPAMPAATDALYSGQRIDPEIGGTLAARAVDQLRIKAPVSLMFVDANGCELQVLRGAAETIGRFRMPIIVHFDPLQAAHFGSTLDDLKAFLVAQGYAVTDAGGKRLWIATPQGTLQTGAETSVAAIASSPARPDIAAPSPATKKLCKLLQQRAQIDECALYLKTFGYVPHYVACKNWDLAHIIPAIGDGNFLDMGSSDSYILKNLALKRIRGELYGIDLRAPDVPISDVKYLIGDLMRTPLPDGYFANITCLSVLEHEVDYDKFAAEAARLLAPGGRVFVTFDYWEPKVTPPVKLYGLAWKPLDAKMVRQFIASCSRHGLEAVEDFDFTAGDALIRWGYYSPHPEISYTFGMAAFRKR